MTVHRETRTRKRPYHLKNKDPREKLFYLFLVAQLAAIVAMVLGVLFFILRIIKVL
ncbi:MAG: hypothetical protein ACOC6B_01085 [Thermodesulfobacteriota bacterium]